MTKLDIEIRVGFKWCVPFSLTDLYILNKLCRDRVVRQLGRSPKGVVYSGQFRNIKEAVIYMLDKPGYNFPLRSGDDIPRPTTTLPYSPAAAKAISPSGMRSTSPSKATARPASMESSDDSFATAHGDTSGDLDVGESGRGPNLFSANIFEQQWAAWLLP